MWKKSGNRCRTSNKRNAQARDDYRPRIFVISGPSGSGKTTLINRLLSDREVRGRLIKAVSFTTRPKRANERQAKDYFFITPGKFAHYRESKKILEWTRYLGYYYGTPKEFVDKALGNNQSLVLCLDLKGALRIKKLYPSVTVTVFIKPGSLGTLYKRITGRCQTCEKEIDERLKMARKELPESGRYDYSLVNKDLEKALKRLKGIFLKETRSRG